jgi:hypothetical protein
VNLPEQPDTILPMQLLDKQKTKWLKPPFWALLSLATATAADHGVVATLTEANTRLVKQLEDNSNELRELKALIKKERFKNEANAVSTHHQTTIAGLIATKYLILTQF